MSWDASVLNAWLLCLLLSLYSLLFALSCKDAYSRTAWSYTSSLNPCCSSPSLHLSPPFIPFPYPFLNPFPYPFLNTFPYPFPLSLALSPFPPRLTPIQTLLEAAYFAVKPPERVARKNKVLTNVQKYIRFLLFEKLDTPGANGKHMRTFSCPRPMTSYFSYFSHVNCLFPSAVDLIIKALRRLPWNSEAEVMTVRSLLWQRISLSCLAPHCNILLLHTASKKPFLFVSPLS